jgi:prepilin-type N-terminal cleavage/methylation domain-containing protein
MTPFRNGFTLLEILLVAVILGALAAVAIPQFTGSKESAYVAAMKADLRVAAVYEEQYAAENHGQYFGGIATETSPLNGFAPSKGISITFTAFNILGSRLSDWTGIARHVHSSQSCGMRAGVISCAPGNSLSTGLISGT